MKSNDFEKPIALISSVRFVGMIILLILAAVNCSSANTCSDDSLEITPAPGVYHMLTNDGQIQIPFEIYRGDVRFECAVNGLRVHMLLDDGFMWDQLLFWGGPEVDSLNLVYDGEIKVGDDSTEKLISKTASGITVTFPGVEFTDQTAVITPSSSGNSSMWRGSAGQISASFFKHFVVNINFDKMIITLIEPENFKYEGKGVAIPWQPLGFGPWSIPATLRMADGGEVSMKLLMDLGYNDQLQLAVGGEHNIALPQKKLPASLGFNIQGVETLGFIGRIPQINIGGYQINDLLASFISEEHSDHAIYEAMIGLRLLSRFNLVFDYNRQRLFIEPNGSFETSFEYDMSGIEMGRASGGYSIIREIHKDSPAEQAGLQAGDKILKINDKVITDYDNFELLSIFKQAGAEVNLLIDRNGQEKKVSLILRRVI